MVKVCGTNYIIRVKIQNEIKTLKFADYDSMMIIAKQFEEQNLNYVIIRNSDLFEVKSLLDYNEDEEE